MHLSVMLECCTSTPGSWTLMAVRGGGEFRARHPEPHKSSLKQIYVYIHMYICRLYMYMPLILAGPPEEPDPQDPNSQA